MILKIFLEICISLTSQTTIIILRKGENHSSQREAFGDKNGLDDDNATTTTNAKKERIINFSFSK